ncbi:VTC domain-containing protein [Mycolicibacterium mucogenicum 261Sha1.1M5]|uniref:polyphosphate polymerase domain-containing protein n=1 Tax=Leucobacter aridicollis TaxID=283878 RepID=UPI000EABDF03|nr:polyphosphate polymerase domain-containing protein [Leucobacter aridicollis]MCS3426577.1 hypothetical protein [Leucobacter aridicollis]RKQ89272.1 VTC domain-containing protein [Mycolicibacterium mucogenicum 261Sha1.1M5]
MIAGFDKPAPARPAPAAHPIEGFAAALPPIALDDLVSEAHLMTRMDRKYMLPVSDALRTLESVAPGARVLEIAGRRRLAYDSVYFDTAEHTAYRLTAQRRRRRFKVRTRCYADTETCFLEAKTKDGRGRTVKQRIPYAVADAGALTPEGRAFVGHILTTNGHPAETVAGLTAGTTSRYRRTTLLLPDGSRATIDTDLLWCDESGARARLERHVIVESKSVGPRSELDSALWRAGHRPTSISKFGTGTAALHPDLPRNKWARTLLAPFIYEPDTRHTQQRTTR